MPDQRRLLVELPLTAKTYDVDYAGIVHNMVYIRWLEDLRTELLEAFYPLERLLAEGVTPILTRTEIEYRQPVRLAAEVQGRMWVTELGRTRWTVGAEVGAPGTLHAAATQQGYFASLETLKPVRVPDALRARWLAG